MRRTQPRWLWMVSLAVLGAWAALSVGCGEEEVGPGGQDDADATAATYARVLADGLPRVDLSALETIIERTAQDDRVLVLDFWATWCGPCVAIFGDVHEAVGGLGDEVRLVTISLDASHDETKAINFLAEHRALGDAFMLRPDTGTRAAVDRGLGVRWQGLALPAILVFNQRGELVREFLGEEAQAEAIAAYVKELVAQQNEQDEQDELAFGGRSQIAEGDATMRIDVDRRAATERALNGQ